MPAWSSITLVWFQQVRWHNHTDMRLSICRSSYFKCRACVWMNQLEIVPHCNRCSCVITLSWAKWTAVIRVVSLEKRVCGIYIPYYATTKVVVQTYGHVKSCDICFDCFFSFVPPPLHAPGSVRTGAHACYSLWVCHMCLGLPRWRTERWIRATRGATRVLQLDCCQVRPALQRCGVNHQSGWWTISSSRVF